MQANCMAQQDQESYRGLQYAFPHILKVQLCNFSDNFEKLAFIKYYLEYNMDVINKPLPL